jgi:hypothetical protein
MLEISPKGGKALIVGFYCRNLQHRVKMVIYNILCLS